MIYLILSSVEGGPEMAYVRLSYQQARCFMLHARRFRTRKSNAESTDIYVESILCCDVLRILHPEFNFVVHKGRIVSIECK